jgi:hypothetical protein
MATRLAIADFDRSAGRSRLALAGSNVVASTTRVRTICAVG